MGLKAEAKEQRLDGGRHGDGDSRIGLVNCRMGVRDTQKSGLFFAYHSNSLASAATTATPATNLEQEAEADSPR